MRKIISCFMAVIFVVLEIQFPIAVNAQTEADFEKLIFRYYEMINEQKQEGIMDLYAESLKNYVSSFFENGYNKSMHEGIYNVKSANIMLVCETEHIKAQTEFEGTVYREIKRYFIKCEMQVYSSDKYYTEGNNYFVFSVGKNISGEEKIINIEIPCYSTILLYDKNMVDVIRYINIRNGFLYGELEGNEIQPTSDAPVYIDYVRNPSTIRVLINGKVDTVDFKTYCKRAAAVEINSGLNYTDGYNACAMALKMFAIHKVNTAAVGANYDINAATDQGYSETKVISAAADAAVEATYNYFLLDYYGAFFPTFYRTQKSSKPTYCVQYGGILPQKEADDLAKTKSWKEILKYYYTRSENVTYYNSLMNYGALIVTTSHVHDWGGGIICAHCGAVAR